VKTLFWCLKTNGEKDKSISGERRGKSPRSRSRHCEMTISDKKSPGRVKPRTVLFAHKEGTGEEGETADRLLLPEGRVL